MDFKWKLSALYINLYIKIALHLKTKRSMILIVKKMKDSEWHAKCCMFESLLCFLNEVPSWLNQEHCALLFPLSHSPTAGIINREIRLLWNIFHILFVKHELVVKDRSTAGSLFAETAAAAAAAAAAAKFAILGTQINATPGSKTETTSVCEKKRKGTFKYQQCDLS